MEISRVLAFETSCDDTSVALVTPGGFVEAVVSANQDLAHAPFGGVVPEIASRNHTLTILPLLDEVFSRAHKTWADVQALTVTSRPGLVGSLLVGISTAKTLSQVKKLPWLGVNHLEGHLLAPFLSDSEYRPEFSWSEPYLALTVSGGHTTLYHCEAFKSYRVLGGTVDDAAGEAFDKFGKMLGLGFPGGVQVDKLAQTGDPKAFQFPQGFGHEDNLKMSFSGLKASAQRLVESLSSEELQKRREDLCASFQSAVVEVLMKKLALAQKKTGLRKIVVTGGVSANSELRSQAKAWAHKHKLQLLIPPLKYCTDNAAMIGLVGAQRLIRGEESPLTLGPSPASWPEDFLHD